MKIKNVKLSQIEQNENSRVVYKESDLSELMQAIKKNGLLQPVGVRELPNGKYDAVYGNRRILACKKLGWEDIPAVIVDATEDKERDVLNLIENLKRQNTTVAEDGRMFSVLIGHGLNEKEIAARLDISPTRVQTALEVFNTVPKEFHKHIVNRISGTTRPKNVIPATTAHQILSIKKTHSLNREQVRSLMSYAQEEDTTIQNIAQVAPLLREGMSLKDAIKASSGLAFVNLGIFMPMKVKARLEKKYKASIQELFIRALETHPEFEIQRKVRGNYNFKAKSITRRAQATA